MEWEEIFKVFSDPTRLRILNLLSQAELNVNEVMEIMDLQQSRVSKHLKILREKKLVRERREGTWRFYSLEEASFTPKMMELLRQVWQEEVYREDAQKVKHILEKRKFFAEDFFLSNQNALGGLGSFYSFENLLMAFSLLIPQGSRVLDGGCGEGKLLWYLGHNREIELYGIDIYKSNFQKTLRRGSGSLTNIRFQKGDLTETSFEEKFFDIVFTNMVLHHIPEPKEVFREVERILKSGGKWIIIDFFKHNQESLREKYKDFWLGFSVEELEKFSKPFSLKLSAHYLVPKSREKNMPDNLILLFEKI